MDCRLPDSSVMGFSRQEYWSGLPFPFPVDLNAVPSVSPASPTLVGRVFTYESPGKCLDLLTGLQIMIFFFLIFQCFKVNLNSKNRQSIFLNVIILTYQKFSILNYTIYCCLVYSKSCATFTTI